MKPTVEMAEEAQRGLAWRAEYNRGGTAIGVARARDISNRVNLSPETIRRMVSYFARHEVDKEGQGFKQGEEGYPSAGRIAWALWGGDAGQAWANQQIKQLENMITIENKAAKVKLNDQVDKISVDRLIDDIAKVYGMKAVDNSYAFGEIIACADNAVDTLEVEIHSGGGSVFEGYRVFNEMKKLSDRGVYVTARINTLAASMGSVIAMAADKVEIASNGKIMIHEASGGAHGDSDTLLRYAELLETISDEIAGIYADKTGIPKDEIRALMKKETWMTAEQAISMGFADEIISEKNIDITTEGEKSATMNLFASKKDLEAAQSNIELLNADIVTLQADLQAANATITDFTSTIANLEIELASANHKATEAEAKIAELTASLETAEESASKKAVEMVADLGAGDPIPAVNESAKESIREQYNKISDTQERQAFRLKHWDALINN